MKGIILAGGLGTRLRPLTLITNKHLLPVYDKPMIYYPLNTLLRAGIKDILIVSGPEYAGHFMHLLRSGKTFGAKISYEMQEEPLGIANALALAEDFADGNNVTVILGDNIFEDDISKDVAEFENKAGAKVFLKAVEDPQRFGVAEVKGDRIVGIEEKPQVPKTDLATVGLYMYDKNVFDIIRTLKPSARGQYEITDVNNEYVGRNALTFNIMKGFWSDAGTHESLFHATQYVRNNAKAFGFSFIDGTR